MTLRELDASQSSRREFLCIRGTCSGHYRNVSLVDLSKRHGLPSRYRQNQTWSVPCHPGLALLHSLGAPSYIYRNGNVLRLSVANHHETSMAMEDNLRLHEWRSLSSWSMEG